jgi:hypothetical protein
MMKEGALKILIFLQILLTTGNLCQLALFRLATLGFVVAQAFHPFCCCPASSAIEDLEVIWA